MSRERQRGFAASLLIPGLLLLVMGLGGTWGQAYGQSGGPPIVAPTIVAGVEGETPPPPRREAVAGESGEAPADAAPAAEAPVEAAPARSPALAGESGGRQVAVAGESEELVAGLIGATGMDDGMRWSLLLAGLLLLAGGSLAFTRARKLR